MRENKIKQTTAESLTSLKAAMKAAYKLAPFFIIIMVCIIVAVTYIAILSTKLMMGLVLLIVLGVTVVVYASTNNFGEAALALVAGLLTAYSVNWTPNRFISFIAVWSAFSFLALIISSIKLASRSESLYRQAAIVISDSSFHISEKEKELKEIAENCSTGVLGPIEKAESLLLFCHRKLPQSIMASALKAVSIISVITEIKPKDLSSFIADAYKVFGGSNSKQQEELIDLLYKKIKESPAAPTDFIESFKKSRHLILSKTIKPTTYLDLLQKALEAGNLPSDVDEYIKSSLINRNFI